MGSIDNVTIVLFLMEVMLLPPCDGGFEYITHIAINQTQTILRTTFI